MLKLFCAARSRYVWLCVVTFCFALLSTPLLARAPNTLHVAASGNDTSPCSLEAPCRTLARAQTMALPGDTVEVGPGVYEGTVILSRSGTPGMPITYRGHSGSCPSIKNSDPQAPPNRPSPVAVITGASAFEVRASHVVIDCFVLRPTSGFAVNMSADSLQDIRVVNVQVDDELGTCIAGIRSQQSAVARFVSQLYVGSSYFTRCQYGLFVTANAVTIEANEIYRNRGSGDTDYIRIFGDGVTIRGNYMHGNTVADCLGAACHIDCIQTYYQGGAWGILKNAVIEQNTCFNAHQGFLAQGAPGTHHDILIRNNVWGRGPADSQTRFSWCVLVEGVVDATIVHNTCADGSVGCRGYAGVASTCTIRGNILDNTSPATPIVTEVVGRPTGQVVVSRNLFFRSGSALSSRLYPDNIWNRDPLFVDPATDDFRLRSGSPAINGATTGVLVDRLGAVRDGSPDIGAYEFQLQPFPPHNFRIVVPPVP